MKAPSHPKLRQNCCGSGGRSGKERPDKDINNDIEQSDDPSDQRPAKYAPYETLIAHFNGFGNRYARKKLKRQNKCIHIYPFIFIGIPLTTK